MIYFIACPEANAVKIGVTGDWPTKIYNRLSVTQTHCPLRVEIMATQPGGYEEEGELLTRFAKDRIQGEWFRLTDELRDHIGQFPKPAAPQKRPYVLRSRQPRWAA